MDGRHTDEYYGARIAPVAQLDRVLPSEGSGRGFESRLVHQNHVSSCHLIPTKHPTKPALCGLCRFCLPPLILWRPLEVDFDRARRSDFIEPQPERVVQVMMLRPNAARPSKPRQAQKLLHA